MKLAPAEKIASAFAGEDGFEAIRGLYPPHAFPVDQSMSNVCIPETMLRHPQ